MKPQQLTKVKQLINNLYFDYDRLSNSGQETLDKVADLLDISDSVSDQELLEMGLPQKFLKSFRGTK